jgi:uncharacterized membrane protein
MKRINLTENDILDIVNKVISEQKVNQPKEPLTLEIVNNYDKLMNYIKNNLKPEDQTKALDMFREAVRRAGAYVPDNI